MKNTVVIGPIQKAKTMPERASILNQRLSKMKVGNFFEVTGLSSKENILSFRSAVFYFSKKHNVEVVTSTINGVLKVERVKSSKTKETFKVK